MNDLDLQRSLGRLEGQLGALHLKVDKLVADTVRIDTKTEDRLTNLEHWQTQALARMGTVSAMVSFGVSMAFLVFKIL